LYRRKKKMGYTKKAKDDIISDILINLVDNVGDITDVNVGAVIRQICEALGLEQYELYNALDEIYNGTRLDTSTGVDLENLGQLVGITRKDGTKANSYVTFITRQAAGTNFTIPIGSIIATQPNIGEEQLRFSVKVKKLEKWLVFNH